MLTSNQTSRMCLRTVNPNPMPIKVAIEMPKMPARIPGMMRAFHPLAMAIPQAVVGPPILAMEAKSSSFSSKPNNLPLPRWTVICTNANKKILDAVFMTFHKLPLAPITVKNTCSQTKITAKKMFSLLSDHSSQE